MNLLISSYYMDLSGTPTYTKTLYEELVRRGTLGATADKKTIIEQSIRAIIETRQGERVLIPDYGIPDWVFDVQDAGFTARVAYFVGQQLLNYEPLIETAKALIGYLDQDNTFIQGFTEEQQIAAFSVVYTERGSNTPRNLVFPTWQLIEVAND